MKLSLIAAAAVASLALGCGTTDEPSVPELPTAAEPTATGDPNASAPPRKLIDGKLLPTSPVNLLTDPGFFLTGQQAGFGSFLSLYEGTFQPYDLVTKLDSRSPSGFGGAVGIVKPFGATDKKSDPILLLASFLGGKGPFSAQVWISKSDVRGRPVDLPTDGSAVKISIADGDPDTGQAYDLAPVEGGTRTAGDRTWVLFRADIETAIPHGGFFVLRTGKKGGVIHVTAPEVTSAEVSVGQSVKSLGATSFRAAGRVVNAAERSAIRRYQAIPPRLVPAAPAPRRGS